MTIQPTVNKDLNDFWKSFTYYGLMHGNHIVQWNETFATDDEERFIRLIRVIVQQGNQLQTPFDRVILIYGKDRFDLYLRTVKAYTGWFYNTLNVLLFSSANLASQVTLSGQTG
jgi:hypothetical protein